MRDIKADFSPAFALRIHCLYCTGDDNPFHQTKSIRVAHGLDWIRAGQFGLGGEFEAGVLGATKTWRELLQSRHRPGLLSFRTRGGN